MAYHVNRTFFPFAFGSRSPSVRHIELIDKAPRAVREEIEIRTQMIEQTPYTQPDSRATGDFFRWLQQRLRKARRS